MIDFRKHHGSQVKRKQSFTYSSNPHWLYNKDVDKNEPLSSVGLGMTDIPLT